jgi:ssDNA-binding Zn-finger/Zn-ribbon topoisomerase 1
MSCEICSNPDPQSYSRKSLGYPDKRMLIKEKAPSDKAIQELETIAKIPGLARDVLARVDKELKTLKAGNRGESDSAYFINFHFRNSHNWAIIHDLRIEYRGNVAQIDHLLISRFLEFYVLESKSYAYGLKITDRGEFMFWDGYRYIAMESPIEQNRRHTILLEQLFDGKGLLPTRLGIALKPAFKPYVLVSPKSRVVRPDRKMFDTDVVIKSDELFQRIKAETDNASVVTIFGSLAKTISSDMLTDLAQRLVMYHEPAPINYYARFDINPVEPQAQPIAPEPHTLPESPTPQSDYCCFRCQRSISPKIATYCLDHKDRFGGKTYCMDCQKTFPPNVTQQPTPVVNAVPAAPLCPKCGIPMVVRIATQGENKGNQFYGCSNYPKCRQIMQLH